MALSISTQTLQRLPSYLSYLKSLPENEANISAKTIADALGLGEVQVRKDLASVSGCGKPKVGYEVAGLVHDLKCFLGYHDSRDAVLVGAGRLGRALLGYKGFEEYGLHLVAGFDIEAERRIAVEPREKPILPMEKLGELCKRMKIRMAVITVPTEAAQAVCDELVENGVLAIWNFAPVHLRVPEGILVKNENMAASLAVLSRHLESELHKEEA